jgi:hypothetical protein
MGYSAGELVQATAEAYNSKGWSTPSEPNTSGVVAKVAPSPPTTITSSVDSTTQITLNWSAVSTSPEDGYSPVTSYNIESNQGVGTEYVLVASSSTTSVTLPGLNNGYTYKFKISAVNDYGEGAFSSVISVVLATIPLQMVPPVIKYSLEDVTITFVYPASGGKPITDFEIWMSSDGINFAENTNLCDGSQTTVQELAQCTMTMSQLLNQGFVAGNIVQAKIRAYNEKGWGPISDVSNTDILVQVPPSPPENLAVTYVDKESLQLNWSALTNAAKLGYASLDEYKVYWDKGISGGDFVLLHSLTATSLLVRNGVVYTESANAITMTRGTTYAFKIAASNIQGIGELSTSVSLEVIGKPDQLSAPTLAEVGNLVRITITPSDINVDKYRISILNPTTSAYVESSCDGFSLVTAPT